jgi:probable rRNA maturation factor
MTPILHIDRPSGDQDTPDDESFRRWVCAALSAVTDQPQNSELSLRLADIPEITQLNTRFRGQAKATNVLSFPADVPPDIPVPLLGDIVICTDVVRREAEEQGKTLPAHWAHMTIHGTLHLLGYDHIDDEEAEAMEALEISILAGLGFPNPYAISDQQVTQEQT